MFKAHHRHYLAGFLLDSAVMIAMTAMPFYIYNQIGGGVRMSGTIAGIQAVAYAVVCILVSGGVVRTPLRGLSGAVFGTGLFALFFGGSVVTRDPVLYAVLTTLGMIGMAITWPALHAWIGAEPNLRRRNRRMSRFNISWSLGFTFGPLAAGPLYTWDPRFPFLLAGILALVAMAIFRAAPDERAYFGEARPDDADRRLRHDRASEVHLYAGWLACLTGNALAIVSRSVYPKRVQDLLESGQLRFLFEETPASFLPTQPATTYMWLAFAVAGANAGAFFVMGRTDRWHHRFGVLAAIQAAAAGAFWVLGTTQSFLIMLLCYGVVGTAWGAGFFAGVFYSVADPVRKVRRTAFNESMVGIGGFAAMGFGALAGQFGMALPFHATPLFVGAALLAQFLLIQWAAQRHRAPAVPSSAELQ